MATVNIGSLRFDWKGAYNGSTAYAVDDVVSYNGSSYICILASTGNLPTNTTYFQPMATKGTDGTDVGTTLTTQGDILYRDGSGLQRLAAGTNGQVLQTGGTGANPSWGTVSSDFVKINTTNISNGASSVNLDGIFTSDYNVYKIFASQIKGYNSTNGAQHMRLRNNNADATGSYWSTGYSSWRTSGANNNQTDGDWGSSSVQFANWNAPDTDTESGNAPYDYEITIFGVNTNNYKQLHYKGGGWEQGNTYVVQFDGFTLLNNTGAIDGFSFIRTGGGFSSDGKIVVYGLKN